MFLHLFTAVPPGDTCCDGERPNPGEGGVVETTGTATRLEVLITSIGFEAEGLPMAGFEEEGFVVGGDTGVVGGILLCVVGVEGVVEAFGEGVTCVAGVLLFVGVEGVEGVGVDTAGEGVEEGEEEGVAPNLSKRLRRNSSAVIEGTAGEGGVASKDCVMGGAGVLVVSRVEEGA